jgi:hypothetical protein
MRRRRWTRRVGAVFGTLALGALIGFLIPTVVAEFTPKPAATAASADESPIAREFIDAFLLNDQGKLRSLGATETDSAKANDLASSAVRVGPPVLLGVKAFPGISFQAYAAPAVLADGTASMLSWRIWLVSGRPLLVPPPNPIDPTP